MQGGFWYNTEDDFNTVKHITIEKQQISNEESINYIKWISISSKNC
jgi:hypothetical protein